MRTWWVSLMSGALGCGGVVEVGQTVQGDSGTAAWTWDEGLVDVAPEGGPDVQPTACLRMHQDCSQGGVRCCPDMACSERGICEVPPREAGTEAASACLEIHSPCGDAGACCAGLVCTTSGYCEL